MMGISLPDPERGRTAIPGEKLQVSGNNRDGLQEVINSPSAADFGCPCSATESMTEFLLL
jgi:uncharacterized protein YajQ (UPF0234 family)